MKKVFFIGVLLFAGCNEFAGNSETSNQVGGQVDPEAGAPTLSPIPSPAMPEELKFTTPDKIAFSSGKTLLDRLRIGGYNIYSRHGHTDKVAVPSDFLGPHGQLKLTDFEGCLKQRMLSEYGTSASLRVGQAIRDLRIPIGKVVSSPYCRCQDTAEGMALTKPELILGLIYARGTDWTMEQFFAVIRTYLSEVPAVGTNTLVVSHKIVLDGIDDIPEGGAYIVEPLGNGELKFIGKILEHEWPTAITNPEYFGYFSDIDRKSTPIPR